ncbi:MAG: hypothetical protein ACREV2_05275 [Burkholderiales bacterium]
MKSIARSLLDEAGQLRSETAALRNQESHPTRFDFARDAGADRRGARKARTGAKSEGERQKEINLADGEKQSAILKSEGEKTAAINSAQCDGTAICLIAEAEAMVKTDAGDWF